MALRTADDAFSSCASTLRHKASWRGLPQPWPACGRDLKVRGSDPGGQAHQQCRVTLSFMKQTLAWHNQLPVHSELYPHSIACGDWW